MQTPERVEEPDSPPYIIVKKEEVEEIKQNQQSELLPPLSTKKSLWQVYEILHAATNLGIEYSHNMNMVDRNYN